MKKVIILLSILFMFANQSFAYNVNHFSTDDKILAALSVLNQTNADEVFEKLAEKSVKIMFYDLTMIDYSFSKDYAITSVDTMGNRYILINSRYKNSQKEALACLIAHESFHTKNVATLSEEIQCTQIEAKYWHILKNQMSDKSSNELTTRLDKLEGLYMASDKNNNRIAECIINNSFYKNQLAIK